MASGLPGCEYDVKSCSGKSVVDHLYNHHSAAVRENRTSPINRLTKREKQGLMLYLSLFSNTYKPTQLYNICALPIFPREVSQGEEEQNTRDIDLNAGFTSLVVPKYEAGTSSEEDKLAMVKAATESWFTLPEFEEAFNVTLDMRRFIARAPLCMPLYDKLQITSLPRHEFYFTWCAAETWQSLTRRPSLCS